MQNSPLVDDLKGDKTTAGSVSSCDMMLAALVGREFEHLSLLTALALVNIAVT